jgi:hypothetical protein
MERPHQSGTRVRISAAQMLELKKTAMPRELAQSLIVE